MTDTENTLTLETTKGKVVILMRPDLAPGHVARIKELVRDGFYDGVAFHRVIEGFMAQTGCPHGTGTGGSGKKLKAEFNKEPHRRGTVSMARAQSPNSGDSQFFICFADAPFLNGKYTVWGEVTEGMGNVDKIKRGEPVIDPDRITSAKMAADTRVSRLRNVKALKLELWSARRKGRRPPENDQSNELLRARGSASHTHASFANHSCSVRQIGQWTRAKNTGIDSKLLRSVTRPVGMSRPVCGHLTMTAPISLSWLSSLRPFGYAWPVKMV